MEYFKNSGTGTIALLTEKGVIFALYNLLAALSLGFTEENTLQNSN